MGVFLRSELGVAPSDALYVVFIGGNDVRSAAQDAETKDEANGFTNTQDPCLTTLGCDFNTFVFFDEIHPTARVHGLAGEAMLRLMLEGDDD